MTLSQEPDAEESTSLQKESSAPAFSILVVDDIQENLALLEEILQGHGYKTIATASAAEALDIATRNRVHLVISDALMPRMDGLELCKNLRKRETVAQIPFIIYTGNYIDRENRELARSVGVDRYVMKSDGIAALVNAVRELVAQRYGNQFDNRQAEPAAMLDDRGFLQRHRELVSKKLVFGRRSRRC